MALSSSCIVLLVVVAVFMFTAVPSYAADVKKCWKGWATGTDLRDTKRNSSMTNCVAKTKYCEKWYLMKGK